jgi:hypothetical protein
MSQVIPRLACVAVTVGATTLVIWPAGQPAASAHAAGVRAIGPPVAVGTLRISGRPRDGGTVLAAGLRWRPGRLPPGDRLLSFEVGYYWRSCRSGRCHVAADSTATPFAAGRYIAGHADTGRRLRLTEVASEVVETDPARFSFTVLRSSASAASAAPVGGYRAGQRPRTEFVNGTPQRRTGSRDEYFGVDPPHYATGDGQPAAFYRIDHQVWRALPRSRVFYTGRLPLGRHAVAVRTANRAGATTLRFAWRVVPLPAPLACAARPRRACWLPPHLDSRHRPMRWDWQIGRVTPLRRAGVHAVDIYDVDGFLTTAAQVSAIHQSWPAATLPHPKMICYLDLAWEDYRPDGSPAPRGAFPPAALGNIYFGFPQERWVDFRQLDALKPMIDARLAMCAKKGFDAVELDDIDGFDPPSKTGFHLTPGDAQNLLAYAFNRMHRLGMTGLWKNSPLLTWWSRGYADGAIVEECYIGRACFASSLRGTSQYGITCTALSGAMPCGWDDFTTDATPGQPTGKWVGEVEYSGDHFVCDPGRPCPGRRNFATFCRRVSEPAYGFAAMKLDANLDGVTFFPCPRGR